MQSRRQLSPTGTAVAVTATLPLAQAAKAHEMLDGGHTRGKIVLTVSDTA